MHKAFTSLLVIAALGAFSLDAVAQTPGPSGNSGILQTTPAKKKHAANFKLIFEGLREIGPTMNFTKDQQDQIDALVKKTQDDIQQIHKDTKGDKAARQQKMMDLGDSYKKSFDALLTQPEIKEYRKAYRDFVKKWHEDHKKNGTAPAAGAPAPAQPTGH